MSKSNLRKIVSAMLCIALTASSILFLVGSRLELEVLNPWHEYSLIGNFEPDEQIFSTATIEDNFVDDEIIIVLTREASRDQRVFTPRDFRGVNVVEVEDLTYLSPTEYVYADALWQAEERVEAMVEEAVNQVNSNSRARTIADLEVSEMLEAELTEAVYRYEVAREALEDNTLLNADEFRRILLIRLAEPGKQNVLDAIEVLQDRPEFRYVGTSGIAQLQATHSVSVLEYGDEYFRDSNYALNQGEFEPLNIRTANDPLRNQQWGLDRININQAWNWTTGSRNVMVGVLDSGIDASHEDLRDNFHRGGLNRAFVSSMGPDFDSNGHGTHVAGIIGAAGNNNIGIAGVAWNVDLVSLEVFGSQAYGMQGMMPFVNAINHARRHNIPLLNFSGGIESCLTPTGLDAAISNYLGLLIIAATNQDVNLNNVRCTSCGDWLTRNLVGRDYPAQFNLPNVIAVTRLNEDNGVEGGRHNNLVHIAAPGGGILSTLPQHRYGELSGTSMAAPHVAGVAALIMSRFPSLRPGQVRSAILRGADNVAGLRGMTEGNNATTGRRLNAAAALSEANQITQNRTIHQMSAGSGQSMALSVMGMVWTWGSNEFGQGGRGSFGHFNPNPTQVRGFYGVSYISSGLHHNLAAMSNGRVMAWGQNSQGQLGINNTANQNRPIEVLFPENIWNITRVAGGSRHSVALDSGGRIWTWGDNSRGQLGLGNTTRQLTPQRIEHASIRNITAIAAGYNFTLALRNDGIVWAWGENRNGQLGINNRTIEFSTTPRQVHNLGNITSIDAAIEGGHAVALRSDGTVWQWGVNWCGQLGINERGSVRFSPIQVRGGITGTTHLTHVHRIAAGGDFVIARRSNTWGTYSWGRNVSGQLGLNDRTERRVPTRIQGVSNMHLNEVAAGSRHAFLFVPASGTEFWAWGNNAVGHLGTGMPTASPTTRPVTGRLTSF